MNFYGGYRAFNSRPDDPTKNEDGVTIRKIHVKGFSHTITQSELEKAFVKYGEIEDCRIKCIDDVPIYAFITFKDPKAATRALRGTTQCSRRKLHVAEADTWHQPRDSFKKSNIEDRRNKPDVPSSQSANTLSESGQSTPCSSSRLEASSSDKTDGCTILDVLNHDCMMNIFSYLTVRELIASQRVSVRWRALVNDKLQSIRTLKTSIWAHEKSPLTTNTLRSLLIKLGASLRKLHLDYELSMLNQRTPQIISKFCLNLTDLLISRVSSMSWGTLLESLQCLKSLSLIYCDGMKDSHFQNISSHLEELTLMQTTKMTGQFLEYINGDNLKKLSMTRCFQVDGRLLLEHFAKFKALRSLSLDDSCSSIKQNMLGIVSLVPNLTEFSVCNIDSDNGSSILASAVAVLNDLEVLLLSKNCMVNDELLKVISKSCPKLHTLDISMKRSFQSRVTNEGVNHLWKLPNLRLLGLGVLGISDSALDKIGIYERASKLQTLVCRHNERITNAGLLKVVAMCPDIRKIDAYGCHEINEQFVKAACEAVKVHPNRTEKLILYIVNEEINSSKAQEVLKELECPLIQVETNEEFCDPLLYCSNLSEYYLSDDSDDDDLDLIDELDPYAYGSDDEFSLEGHFFGLELDDIEALFFLK